MDTSLDTLIETESDLLLGVPYQAQVVEKGWGAEHILGPSTGYLFKKLFMKEGCRCSLQLHNFKEETILVITGQLKVTVRVNEPDFVDSQFILGPGDYMHISPRTVHRMEALENTYYVEASTNYPDDVLRLQTDYPEPEDVHVELVGEYKIGTRDPIAFTAPNLDECLVRVEEPQSRLNMMYGAATLNRHWLVSCETNELSDPGTDPNTKWSW